jgi:tRNA pseudouridine55 synthase
VGRFQLGEARHLDQITPDLLRPLEEGLKPMPMLELSAQQVLYVREGRQIGVPEIIESPLVGLIEPGVGLFSVARVHGNLLQPECVIPSEAMHGVI